MEIGVYGGTYNPVHNGELIVARQAHQQENLRKIIFVPNGNPPHKKLGVLDKELRFELLSAAVASEKDFEVSRLEIDRPGISWTIDTLRELKRTLGSAVRLNFIIGEDNVRSFEQYEHRKEFFKLCRLLVSPRQTPEQSNLDDWKARLPEAEIVLLNCVGNAISSTMIRSLIRNGQDYSQFVPAAVKQIIEAKGLYKTQYGMSDAA
ncbi:MAG: nicotinate-nucleotide adenylyltransferase [Candidatus Obscuribacterales bacterium]|nr:nicotinate-nucleotide adenylyltransferase [Candidatus Obscuribacterales bacterium]